MDLAVCVLYYYFAIQLYYYFAMLLIIYIFYYNVLYVYCISYLYIFYILSYNLKLLFSSITPAVTTGSPLGSCVSLTYPINVCYASAWVFSLLLLAFWY